MRSHSDIKTFDHIYLPTKKQNMAIENYTKYEKARILGARALQLSMNAPILLNISKEKLEGLNYDPLKIAELEFDAHILPITIKRPFPEKHEEEEEEIEEIIKEEEEKPAEKLTAIEKEAKKEKAVEELAESEPIEAETLEV